MHEVLVNRLGGLSLPRKSVVRLTDRFDMTLDVYHGRKTTTQQQQQQFEACYSSQFLSFYLNLLLKTIWYETLKFQFSMQTIVLSYCFERITLLIIRYKLSKDLESNKVFSFYLKLFAYIVFRAPHLKAGESFLPLCFITGN